MKVFLLEKSNDKIKPRPVKKIFEVDLAKKCITILKDSKCIELTFEEFEIICQMISCIALGNAEGTIENTDIDIKTCLSCRYFSGLTYADGHYFVKCSRAICLYE